MVVPMRSSNRDVRPTRRVLLVEDEDFIAALLVESLEAAGFDVRRADDVLAARRLVRSFDPDVALLDIDLGPGPNGIDLAHYLDRVHPDIALIFLTRLPDHRSIGFDVADVPARAGFLRKDMVGEFTVVVGAIDAVVRGAPSEYRDDRRDDRPLRGLTPRQLEALRLASLGLSNAAIARERGITERAAEKLLQSALQALGVPDDPGMNRRVEGVRRFVASAGLPTRRSLEHLGSSDGDHDG
jgi:DNA-binding NarL/FixJ family response regulator